MRQVSIQAAVLFCAALVSVTFPAGRDARAATSYSIRAFGNLGASATTGQGFSSAKYIGADGTAVGSAYRYVGGNEAGILGVVAAPDGGAPVQLSLDARPDGGRYSEVMAVGPGGAVAAIVEQYSAAGVWLGNRAAIWQNSSLQILPLLSAKADGTGYAWPIGFGPDGSVAGWSTKYLDGAPGPDVAVRWRNGQVIELPSLSPNQTVAIAGVQSKTGTMFGQAGKLADGAAYAAFVGAIWVGDNVLQCGPIGTPPPADSSVQSAVVAVNAHDVATGWAYKYGSNGESLGGRAATWTNGIVTELPSLGTDAAGFTYAEATDINDQGDVVGFSTKYVSNSLRGSRGVFWRNGVATECVIPNSGSVTFGDSGLSDVNDNGQAIGGVERRINGGSPQFTAFAYSNGTCHLIAAPGANVRDYTTALVLGDDGTVYGSNAVWVNSTVRYAASTAFLWTESGGYVDLASLVPGGIAALGWSKLSDVRGVNASGQIIGNGVRLNGETQGFVMSIVPEPLLASCFLCSLIAFSAARRRRA